MAEAKHTLGPWHVEPQQDGASWEICTEKRGAWIMVLRSTAEATDEERAEDLANAQLMATAPDLLDVVDEALEFLGDLTDSIQCTDRVQALEASWRAARAKATGSAA